METSTGAQFKCTKAEYLAIGRIVHRAATMDLMVSDRVSLQMDLAATHSNGCKIDFDKLENSPTFDFAHDIIGIQSHINRETGEIENFFLPRASR